MPIHVPLPIRKLSQDEFKQLDFDVMRHAFACQNELGRFCDENIYQTDLAERLAGADFKVNREVRVIVTCRDFTKEYRLDLLVADGAVYELKAVQSLNGEHESQLMNYLFLVNASHGKLVNFRSASVESRFVNAVVSSEEQRRYTFARDRWQELGASGRVLTDLLAEVVADWGAYLETRLYVEALTHFLGGESTVVRAVPLRRADIDLGLQKMHLLTESVAFRVTAHSGSIKYAEADLHRLLALTPLKAIQWINFNRHSIELVTLTK